MTTSSTKVHPFTNNEANNDEEDDESEFETSDSEYYSSTASESTGPPQHANPAYNEYDVNGHRIKKEGEEDGEEGGEEGEEVEEQKKKVCQDCCYNCGRGCRKFKRSLRRAWRRCWPLRKVRKAWRRFRHRKHDDDEMSGGARCCFGFLVFVAQILLHGVLGLVLYWVIQFHSKEGATWPFAWKDDPQLEFNLHPVLMIVGFIYFMGQAMLMYRSCRCCRRIWTKLLHTMFHLMAAPCIAIGFIAVLDSHNLRVDKDGNPAPIPNFYSLHSWMGLTTMGLFALQFIVGFFSFLLLLCCESATASFRAALVPVHSTFGITTFVMAVATCCTGLTEQAFFSLSSRVEEDDYSTNEEEYFKGIADLYTELPNEAIIVNTIAAALVGLVILIPCIVKCDSFRKGLEREGSDSRESI